MPLYGSQTDPTHFVYGACAAASLLPSPRIRSHDHDVVEERADTAQANDDECPEQAVVGVWPATRELPVGALEDIDQGYRPKCGCRNRDKGDGNEHGWLHRPSIRMDTRRMRTSETILRETLWYVGGHEI